MNPDDDKLRLETALGRGIVEERIDKSDLVPLFDTSHAHEYALDPTDDEPGYYAEVCVVNGCGMGRLIRKQ